MCADMSRIEWNKDKKPTTNTKPKHNNAAKGQRASYSDCSSATSFFNFLTQR